MYILDVRSNNKLWVKVRTYHRCIKFAARISVDFGGPRRGPESRLPLFSVSIRSLLPVDSALIDGCFVWEFRRKLLNIPLRICLETHIRQDAHLVSNVSDAPAEIWTLQLKWKVDRRGERRRKLSNLENWQSIKRTSCICARTYSQAYRLHSGRQNFVLLVRHVKRNLIFRSELSLPECERRDCVAVILRNLDYKSLVNRRRFSGKTS